MCKHQLLDLDELLKSLDESDKFKMKIFDHLRGIYPIYKVYLDIDEDNVEQNIDTELDVLLQIHHLSIDILRCYQILLDKPTTWILN